LTCSGSEATVSASPNRRAVSSTLGMKKDLEILIIEDVAQDAECIERELRESEIPYRARRVETRADFLQALEQMRPDVILSDFTLPEFDALQAIHTLRSLGLEVPFILVTGTRSEEVAVECIKEGADDYILKASLKRLPTSITNALRRQATENAKHHAEVALRRSEEQYRLIATHTQDLICILEPGGHLVYVSPSHRNLGYKPEQLIGLKMSDLVHPDDRSAFLCARDEAQATAECRTVEVRLKSTAGEWLAFESAANWIADEHGHPQRAVIVSRDITHRKKAEEALRELPKLIREAQESERRRVARELHDSVNQILSAVKFRLQTVEDRLEQSDESAWRESLKAKAHLDRAMQEVRRISRNLRPSELDDLGLVPAARTLCSEFGERTGIQLDFSSARVPEQLGQDTELNTYRILQEALGNIEKHARARHAKVELTRHGSHLRLLIQDNGDGFAAGARTKPRAAGHGMGLVDMRERATSVGGTFAVTSAPGRGTEILVEIPIPFGEHPRPKPGEKGQTKED
jgi:two-component system sensor histidine kinase UhpB